uniref:T. congolense-specific, cell surface-expressed gene family n=1 Tax=Trypanosoma congolense (strain IL3000) TaxID=1068625 RepID=G0UMS1_TRYCI|nr:hypothetical protein, unlikely [Trypanosoma congolense IL3000]
MWFGYCAINLFLVFFFTKKKTNFSSSPLTMPLYYLSLPLSIPFMRFSDFRSSLITRVDGYAGAAWPGWSWWRLCFSQRNLWGSDGNNLEGVVLADYPFEIFIFIHFVFSFFFSYPLEFVCFCFSLHSSAG